MEKLDFRSDTVTWPTPAMREAMATAPVGDDVYGEDPMVNALEARAAELLGKEAAVFVASGTMGNLVGVLTHAGRGDEAILGHDSHIFRSEAGGMASLGSIFPRSLATDRYGRMNLDEVSGAVRGSDPHHPRTRLICVENSYGNRNGYPVPVDYFAGIREIADRHGLGVHLDGARLFNAATALDVPASEIAAYVDSASICLSKGLSAPVGSLLCGSRAFIQQARRVRKQVGGGMRQAGILAAAGLVALEQSIPRLAQDHLHARRLAEGLAEIAGVSVDLDTICTNIVFFDVSPDAAPDPAAIPERLRQEYNIWIGGAYGHFRAVTHQWVSAQDVDRLLNALREVLQ